MDKGLLGVILVASVCLGLILSVFGAIILVGSDVLFSPPQESSNIILIFFGAMLLVLALIAFSFKETKHKKKRR